VIIAPVLQTPTRLYYLKSWQIGFVLYMSSSFSAYQLKI
jgi:hypothetical protein